MNELYFIPLGVIVGMISAFFGLGGGIIFVPTLSYFFTPAEAVAISVCAMVFSSIFGTALNIRSRAIDLRYAAILAAGGILGGVASSFILLHVRAFYLLVAFFIFGLVSLYKFILGSKKHAVTRAQMSEGRRGFWLFCGGVITGLFAISLGIGGGLILAPILAHLLGYDSKKIVPASLFFIVFSSLSGLLSFYHSGLIDTAVRNTGLIIGASSLIGVFIGNKLLRIIPSRIHRSALIIIFLFSILMTFNKILQHYGLGLGG